MSGMSEMVVKEDSSSEGEDEGEGRHAMTKPFQIIHGDCKEVLENEILWPRSVHLIITSPPYADQRRALYGGVHPEHYVAWFLPKATRFREVLAEDGSFVLNIKEKALNGERHPYVLHLILALRRQGWLWIEEYCWHKKNAYPGWWPNRFRDSWERCLHFSLHKKFKMRQQAVMTPTGAWRKTRLRNLSQPDRTRDESKNKNGFGTKIENGVGRDMAYPTNVLHLATECGYRNHPAAFPEGLPSWFIRLFTDEGDTVSDPFAGSGTTLVAALRNKRQGVAIDANEQYCKLMRQRMAELQAEPAV